MSAHDPKDVARLREALASPDEGTGDPVAPERIFDALYGDLTPEERQAVVEQILTDPAAAEAWRLARDMRPDGTGDGALEHAAQESMQPAAEPAGRGLAPGAIASVLPHGAELPRAQPVLRWSGVAGARYRLRVLTADRQVLEESAETSAREYTIRPETLARIPPAGQILWQVEARIPGEVIITSATFNHRVP